MTHAFRIRPAHAADAGFIADWNAAMALETEGKTLDAATVHAGVAAGIADPRKSRYFVAMEDASFAGAETIGVPVGTLMLTTEWSDWRNGDWWWIQSVYVPKEHRGKACFRRCIGMSKRWRSRPMASSGCACSSNARTRMRRHVRRRWA
jgi:hypothetical protein